MSTFLRIAQASPKWKRGQDKITDTWLWLENGKADKEAQKEAEDDAAKGEKTSRSARRRKHKKEQEERALGKVTAIFDKEESLGAETTDQDKKLPVDMAISNFPKEYCSPDPAKKSAMVAPPTADLAKLKLTVEAPAWI